MNTIIDIYKDWRINSFVNPIRPEVPFGICQNTNKYDILYRVDKRIKNVFNICKYIDTGENAAALKQPTLNFTDGIFNISILSAIRAELLSAYNILGIDYSVVDGFNSIEYGRNNPIDEISSMLETVISRVNALHMDTQINTDTIRYLHPIMKYCNAVLYNYYQTILSYNDLCYINKVELNELLAIFKFVGLYTRNKRILYLRDQLYILFANISIALHNIEYLYSHENDPQSYISEKKNDYCTSALKLVEDLQDIDKVYNLLLKETERVMYGNQGQSTFDVSDTNERITYSLRGLILNDNEFNPDFNLNILRPDCTDHIENMRKLCDCEFSFNYPANLKDFFSSINSKYYL